jgi:Uncharacterized protein conserved in bacteria (DUF2188)
MLPASAFAAAWTSLTGYRAGMTSIEVVAHGDRWAVRADGDTRSEHLTREEAESEARRLGASDPVVREDDPSGLDRVQDDVDAPRGPDAPVPGLQPAEHAREPQAGL